METVSRLFPYVWPYRRMALLSIICAVFISILWAGNLSTVLPMVRVLFQDKNLHQYVDEQIELTQAEVEHRKSIIDQMPTGDVERRARAQRHLSDTTRQLALLATTRKYVLPYVPSDRFDTIALIFGCFLFATLLKGIFIYLQEILVGSIVNRVIVDVRKKCFRHALSLDYQTIAAAGPANLISRITNDVETLAIGLRTVLVRLIREPLKAGGCIAFAFVLNWRLTLLSLLVVPCIGLLFAKFGKSLKKASKGTLNSMSGIYKGLAETFDSLKVVIAFGAARRHRRQFHLSNKEYLDKSMKVIRLSALARPTTELMGTIAVLSAVIPGTYLVLRGTDEIWGVKLAPGAMDIAQLSALYALLAGTLDSVRKLSSVYGDLKRSAAASDRIFEVLNEKTKVPEPKEPQIVGRHSRDIRFENVSFTYSQEAVDGNARPPALRNVSVTVPAGEVVAVIGENGSGKSTLLNMLPRFMDPDQGAVLIDGVDVRQFRSHDLRSQIGIVTQETQLFDDSIAENIKYSKPDATWEEVEEAAKQAHVIPFVSHLPAGFATQIGEKGQKLSGGQRQRIALARAILRDPSILILDEATSALDSQSEHIIHKVLKQFVRGRTVFVITHVINDTFLDLVTRIVVMDSGSVAAIGTHDELLKTCAIYQRLYHSNKSQRAA
ncbi:MAG: ABC transporter ATP-binding protein [Planctomycetota bacterium]|nr:ABC transporter ATP-binding protein [Planctomycetota bacterium]MDA0920954.1 ABC transporter ATP-binding protein [Planctomycetota bacterium]